MTRRPRGRTTFQWAAIVFVPTRKQCKYIHLKIVDGYRLSYNKALEITSRKNGLDSRLSKFLSKFFLCLLQDRHMSTIASLATDNSTVRSGKYLRKNQSSALLALCEGNILVTAGFSKQRVSNAARVPSSCHHVVKPGNFIHILLKSKKQNWWIWVNASHGSANYYRDVTMSAMASQITDISTICSTVCWGAHQRKHQSSTSLAFVRGIHRWPVDSLHKGPVMRKYFHLMTPCTRNITTTEQSIPKSCAYLRG